MRPHLATYRSVFLASGLLALATGATVGGFALLARHQSRAGDSGKPAHACPSAYASLLHPELPTLLLFAHPQCPCTIATIAELERVAAKCEGRLHVIVCVDAPAAFSSELVHGRTWTRASATPSFDVKEDAHGRIASAFGVRTSGHALLFAPDGELLFDGGITGSRGHEGDNPGSLAVVDIVLGRAPDCRFTPVYGCALFAADVPPEAL